jgi:hypothetical protein
VVITSVMSLWPNWIRTKSPFFKRLVIRPHEPLDWNVRLLWPLTAPLTTLILVASM